ncbi:MAG: hypothetical protein EXR69_09295 [Myxococcales bacterium]|nr:hypothetical protein [Myxococcales bacterium]
MSVGEAAAALVAALNGAGVRWYVFGAQAVMMQGIARTTQDIDVTVLVGRRAAPALTAALEGGGFEHRFPERATELVSIAAVIPMKHSASGVDIDIVMGGSGLEELAHAAAERRPLDGVIVPVANATHLAVMKVLAGRAKDLDDVRGLLAADVVDRAAARDLLGQLEAALDQSDLVPAFDRLVVP